MTIAYASLDDIDAAIFNALQQGTKANGGPFTTVGRWMGAPSGPIGAEAIDQELFGRTPSALLAFNGEVAESEIHTLAGGAEVRGRSMWSVLVAVSDPRSTGKVVKGSTALSGALSLASLIAQSVNLLIVPAPAATLTFQLTGTPNATATFGASVLRIGGISFTPTVASVTLNGAGTATVNAACTTPGALGNFPVGSPAAWSAPVTGLNASPSVSAIVTAGVEGLLRNKRVEYVGTRVVTLIPGRIAVLGVQFTADRRIQEATFVDEGQPFSVFLGSQHLKETAQTPPDPIDQFQTNL